MKEKMTSFRIFRGFSVGKLINQNAKPPASLPRPAGVGMSSHARGRSEFKHSSRALGSSVEAGLGTSETPKGQRRNWQQQRQIPNERRPLPNSRLRPLSQLLNHSLWPNPRTPSVSTRNFNAINFASPPPLPSSTPFKLKKL